MGLSETYFFQLERLTLDLTYCLSLHTDDLTASLALLCRAIPSLSVVEVTTDSVQLNAGACVQSAGQLLARWGIIPAPVIRVTDAGGSDGSDSDGSHTDSDDD